MTPRGQRLSKRNRHEEASTRINGSTYKGMDTASGDDEDERRPAKRMCTKTHDESASVPDVPTVEYEGYSSEGMSGIFTSEAEGEDEEIEVCK